MVLILSVLALSSIVLAAPSALLDKPTTMFTSTLALSEKLGIAAPNFTDEAAIWATTFHKTDANGLQYAVQLPRVYTAGQYDAAGSEQYFLTHYASSSYLSSAHPISSLSSRAAAYTASLSLKYCNKGHGSGTCTGFSLNYNSGGCQAAPGTNSIVLTYSNNAAVVAWNGAGCSGKHTLFANGCNGGNVNVDDETPGTNSFQFIVGCTF